MDLLIPSTFLPIIIEVMRQIPADCQICPCHYLILRIPSPALTSSPPVWLSRRLRPGLVDGLRPGEDDIGQYRIDELVMRLARDAFDGDETEFAELLARCDERPYQPPPGIAAQPRPADRPAAVLLNSPIQPLCMIRCKHEYPPLGPASLLR